MLGPDFAVVIASRHRSRTIVKQSLKLFPYAMVTVDENEVATYARTVPEEQLLPHPPLEGLLEVENWLHDQDLAEFVWIVADDLVSLRSHVGWRPRVYKDPERIADVLESTAICARDAGAFLFGVGHHMVPAYFQHDRPFNLAAYVRNVYGYRRGHGLRGDPTVRMHYDVDIALQSLLRHRIIWRDDRFVFTEGTLLGAGAGGNAGLVSRDDVERTNAAMAAKWGRWVKCDVASKRIGGRGNWSKTRATVIMVPRKYA